MGVVFILRPKVLGIYIRVAVAEREFLISVCLRYLRERVSSYFFVCLWYLREVLREDTITFFILLLLSKREGSVVILERGFLLLFPSRNFECLPNKAGQRFLHDLHIK